jgi:hypothetical protein
VAGFLASGSSYLPRLPGFIQWHNAAFIACLQLRVSEGFAPSSLLTMPCGTAPKPVGQSIVQGLYQSAERNVKDKLT